VSVTWSAPVRFVECDQQGVVFNAHYLVWADEAATAWWASIGLPWDEIAARADPVVKASSLEWSSPVRWGDTVEVDAAAERLGRTSLALRLTVRVGERVCCVVRNTYVGTAGGASTPWPDDVRERLTAALSAG
jgi:acyl-CoA thioester hydrolase